MLSRATEDLQQVDICSAFQKDLCTKGRRLCVRTVLNVTAEQGSGGCIVRGRVEGMSSHLENDSNKREKKQHIGLSNE